MINYEKHSFNVEEVEKTRKFLKIKSAFGYPCTIAAGPFAKMKYSFESHGSSIVPKLVGSYEAPLESWIEEAIKNGYNRIIDIGCAEGYYAVGLAFREASPIIYASF